MAGSAVRKRQLGRELERLRKAAGMTQGRAASALDCSTAKIAHFESGRNLPQRAELLLLVQTYGAEQGTYEVLDEVRREAAKPGWWSTARLPDWLAAYVGLESDAQEIRSVQLEVIPGLLQTEDYAREMHISAGSPNAKDLERRIAARLRRQQRLTEDKPLQFSAVISESALARCAHSTMGRRQLAEIHKRAQWPNIDIRVLPFSSGMHGNMLGGFSVLTFPHGLLPDTGYQEYAVGGHLIDDATIVRQLDTVSSGLRKQALNARDSLAMLAKSADDG